MKKRINLFTQKKNTSHSDDSPYSKVRNGSIALLLLLIVIGVALPVYSRQLDQKTRSLQFDQTVAIHKLQESNKDSAKIKLLLKNKDLLDKDLKEDAKFLPYYNLLSTLLLSLKGKPVLTSLHLNKSREASFTIAFSNYDDLKEFLATAETESFSQNFEKLTISSFSIKQAATTQELSVTATFKPIYEQ